MAGLIPSTGEQRSFGRRGFVTVRARGVEEQLLALCGLRRETKSWTALTILLWVDGWPIESNRLKTAVLAEMPGPYELVMDDGAFDRLDELARRKGARTFRRLHVGRIGYRQASEGAYLALLLALGQVDDLDESAEQTIRRVAGLGSKPEVGEATADTESARFAAFVGLFSVHHLRSAVEDATEVDLAAVRPRAHFLLRDLPDLIRAADLYGGRTFSRKNLRGIERVGGLASRARWVAVSFPLVLAYEGIAQRLDTIFEPLIEQVAQARELLRIGDIYQRKHPDQIEALRKVGLRGLEERGLLVPLTPADLADGPSA